MVSLGFSEFRSPSGSSKKIRLDGRCTHDSGLKPVVHQQIAGLADGGTYAFYICAHIASGVRKISIAVLDNAYLASGQTGLWAVVRQYAANDVDWTPARSTSGAHSFNWAPIPRKLTPAPDSTLLELTANGELILERAAPGTDIDLRNWWLPTTPPVGLACSR